jgi:hypothetical protein
MTQESTDGVVSVEELGPDEDRVRPLGRNRYVVDTDRSPPATDGGERPTDPRDGPVDADGAYAVEVRGRFGDDERRTRVATNDVSESFESLVRWYADAVAADAPPEEVLAVLLDNSDLDVDVRRR